MICTNLWVSIRLHRLDVNVEILMKNVLTNRISYIKLISVSDI